MFSGLFALISVIMVALYNCSHNRTFHMQIKLSFYNSLIKNYYSLSGLRQHGGDICVLSGKGWNIWMHDKSLLQENKCIFVTKMKLSDFYFGLILKRCLGVHSWIQQKDTVLILQWWQLGFWLIFPLWVLNSTMTGL